MADFLLSGMSLPLVWAVILIILVGIELATAGLTTIWFAGGALAALILSLLKVPLGFQIAAFFVVSIVLLVFTRPLVVKKFNPSLVKTNAESLIGKTARVTERIDNISATGHVVVDGQDWSARSTVEGKIYEEGWLVKIVKIEGVKLIVELEKE